MEFAWDEWDSSRPTRDRRTINARPSICPRGIEVRAPAPHNRGMKTRVLLLGTALAGLGLARIQPGEPPKITIRVSAMTAIPEKTLRVAGRTANEILSKAGLVLVWVDCMSAPASCLTDEGPNEFRLYMLASRRSKVLHEDTEGYAVLLPPGEGQSYAGVYYPLTGGAADRFPYQVPYLLGAAMAHEIGHLLLGAKAHTPTGLMAARFDAEHAMLASRGELRFTSGQAARLRAEAWRRINRSTQP
jgi:hypothetical protein